MKTLKQILSILVITLVSFSNANAQNGKPALSNQEVQTGLVETFANFVESVKPFYSKGDTYNQFKRKALLGTTDTKPSLPVIPKEGENMLKKAYSYLSRGFTYSQIIKDGDYKTMGKAVVYISNQAKSKNKSFENTQSIIFGDDLLINNPFDATRKKCKWWQLACHLNDIFGDGVGDQIIQLIIIILTPR